VAKKETVSRTLKVALALCVVCSVIVSAAAVSLKPTQITNRNLDIKTNILAAAGMLQSGASKDQIEEEFARFEVKLLDLETLEYVEPSEVNVSEAMRYDQYRAAADPQLGRELDGDEDPASIKRKAKVARVFVLEDGEDLTRVVLPIHGYGLWSTLYGFISLEGDANTIEGLTFYAHADTPRIGGEVVNNRWKQQWVGKIVYDENDRDEPKIRLVKGGVSSGADEKEHKVDALSGATLTSRGVEDLVNYWMGERGFAPYLKKLREGEEV